MVSGHAQHTHNMSQQLLERVVLCDLAVASLQQRHVLITCMFIGYISQHRTTTSNVDHTTQSHNYSYNHRMQCSHSDCYHLLHWKLVFCVFEMCMLLHFYNNINTHVTVDSLQSTHVNTVHNTIQ